MTSHPTVGYDGMWTRPEDDPRTGVWFYRRLRGHRDAPRLYWTEEDPDLDQAAPLTSIGCEMSTDQGRRARCQLVA